MKRIFFYHLLNDFSGSPKVLRQIILNVQKEEVEIVLNTSESQRGFLSDITGVSLEGNSYTFYDNKILRLFALCFSQFLGFLRALVKFKKEDIVYINTLLPFGAALAAKIKGSTLIYHIHENSIKPKILMWFLVKVASITATEIIYVSNYVRDELNINHAKESVIYNAIDRAFLSNMDLDEKCNKQKRVLMVCSLKFYKGVVEFVELARSLSNYSFDLVLNASQEEVRKFETQQDIPSNLLCYAKQENLHPFYKQADLVLNLSHPDLWVETFGLTVLEAMFYGKPTIVPPVGGVMEIVKEDESSYCISVKNLKLIQSKIEALLNDNNLYSKFSKNAREKAQEFLPEQFDLAISERFKAYS